LTKNKNEDPNEKSYETFGRKLVTPNAKDNRNILGELTVKMMTQRQNSNICSPMNKMD